MDLILVHIGDELPLHLFDCIEQARRHSSDRITIGVSNIGLKINCADNLEWVDLRQFDNSPMITEFNNHSYFKDMQWRGFWEHCAKRIFYVYAIMELYGLDNALHIENDVLLFYPIQNIASKLSKMVGDNIGLMQVTETLDIISLLYIGSLAALKNTNEILLSLMSMGTVRLKQKHGSEMLNEMRLLNLARTHYRAPSKLLPILPIFEHGFICDPASYGQYIGGTFQDKKPGHLERVHIVGAEIMDNKISIFWKDKKPFVECLKSGTVYQLLSLHVHSKQLKKWMEHV